MVFRGTTPQQPAAAVLVSAVGNTLFQPPGGISRPTAEARQQHYQI